MSHFASSWLAELPASSMSASQFRVMFHLCDAHNRKRPPETACFPTQERLREVTGLSNGGLNNALNELESAGLIRRRRTRSPDGTKGPTYYILGCDFGSDTYPSPESGEGDDVPDHLHFEGDQLHSGGDGPSPFQAPNHLQPSGDKPVIQPGREEEERADARDDFPEMVRLLSEALGDPQIAEQDWWRHEAGHGARITAWRALGLTEAQILDVARQHALDYPEPPRGPKALDRAMKRAAERLTRTGQGGSARPRAGTADLLDYWRGLLASDRYIAPSALTSSTRGLLIAKGVATHESLRARGL